jgi:hypothetical protein
MGSFFGSEVFAPLEVKPGKWVRLGILVRGLPDGALLGVGISE